MITFETQKDFDDAVMAVIAQRLEIKVDKERDHGYMTNVTVALVDVVEGCISEAYA